MIRDPMVLKLEDLLEYYRGNNYSILYLDVETTLKAHKEEIQKLRAELAELRPEPRFHVGQVVGWEDRENEALNKILRIEATWIGNPEIHEWKYYFTNGGVAMERYLRALREEEYR